MIMTPAYKFVVAKLKTLEVKYGRKVSVAEIDQDVRINIGKALAVLEVS